MFTRVVQFTGAKDIDGGLEFSEIAFIDLA